MAAKPYVDSAVAALGYVGREWEQRPYKGSVIDACCCTLGLLDLTWPTCLGLKYRGLCVCVEGDCRMCVPNSCLEEEGVPDALQPQKKCICCDGELYVKSPPCANEKEGTSIGDGCNPEEPVCKNTVHVCCYEQRIAFPHDDEVPCMLAFCCVTCVQNYQYAPQVKLLL